MNSAERKISMNMSRAACGLTLAMFCVLLPRPSFGFAFSTVDSNGVPVPNQTIGVPITWPSTQVNGFVGFGNFPQGFMPINGSGSWDENVSQALQEWTDVRGSNFRFIGVVQVGDFCAVSNGEVNSGWAGDNCGQSFGDAIAVTRIIWRIVEGQAEIDDADIVFNNTLNWDVYDGPTRINPTGDVIYDFRRTVLHEFGHALGLGHPDVAGQTVVSVMNATSSPGSGPDRLTADDKNGVIALYGSFEAKSESGGGSSSFDVGLVALILLVFALRRRCG